MSIGWFPQQSPDGQRLLCESGDGYVTLDNRKLFVGFGPPVWRDAKSFIFSDELNPGVYLVGLSGERLAKLYDKPLIELAACPTLWAGRDPQRNVLVVSDGREIVNAGQPSISPDGSITWRTGDNMIEPSVSNRAHAWGDGHGRIRGDIDDGIGGDLTVAGPEYRPRCVDTPDGPWLLTMTHTALRLRPFGASDGFVKETGDNGNLNSHVICVGRELRVVYQDARGHLAHWNQSIDSSRTSFERSPQVPPSQPDSPSNPAMPTPNRFDVVQDEFAKQPPAPNSTESCGEFTRRVARRLHADDPHWGMLTKTPGEAQYAGFAVDAIIYQPTQQVVDIIGGAEGPNPQPVWIEQPKRDTNHWAVPPEAQTPVPSPQPPVDHSGDVLAELRKLAAANAEIQSQIATITAANRIFERDIVLLQKSVSKLEHQQYRVVVGRSWGHSHETRVEVSE